MGSATRGRGHCPHPCGRRAGSGGKTRADSCPVSIQGEARIDVPAVKLPKEKVIDTTAAGDSFSAGYLAVRLTGGSATDAAKRGHLTASTVIQYRGAIIPHDAMPQ